MKKSLRVRGLDPKGTLADNAHLIVRDRLRRAVRLSRRFLERPESEDLGDLRMALSRVRYPLECFAPCFPRRLYDTVLDRIELVQTACAQIRDQDYVLDLLKTRDKALEEAGNSVAVRAVLQDAITTIEAEQAERTAAFVGMLTKVLESDSIRRFRRELRKVS